MEVKLFFDKNKNPINFEKIYMDVVNDVSDIYIIKQNNNYFAKPEGLDAEPLENVCNGLVIQEEI